MKRSLYGHTLVAGIVAIAAYVAWTQPKSTGDDSKVTVVDGSVERLTAVEYQEERWDVSVQRTGDEEFAVTVQRKHPAPKPKKADNSKAPNDGKKTGEATPEGAKPGEAKPEASSAASSSARLSAR